MSLFSSSAIKSLSDIDNLTDEMVEVFRKKSPAEKLTMSFMMWEFARELLRNSIKGARPELSESDLDHEVTRRMAHGSDNPA